VILVMALALAAPFGGAAYATDSVTTHRDENGWKLKVNGKDFYIKGVVWGYAPRNETWEYRDIDKLTGIYL